MVAASVPSGSRLLNISAFYNTRLSLDESNISLSAVSPLILLFLVVTNERKYCLTQQVMIFRNSLSQEVVLAGDINAI